MTRLLAALAALLAYPPSLPFSLFICINCILRASVFVTPEPGPSDSEPFKSNLASSSASPFSRTDSPIFDITSTNSVLFTIPVRRASASRNIPSTSTPFLLSAWPKLRNFFSNDLVSGSGEKSYSTAVKRTLSLSILLSSSSSSSSSSL